MSLGTQESKLSPVAQYEAEQLLKNYKLTPGTLAFKLENRKVLPGAPLRWYPSPHLMYISLKIARGIARGNARIIISAPPRHGKSRISTVNAPIWALENFPTHNVVITTYGQDLSSDFGREIRDTIMDCPDLLNVRVRDDVARANKFVTESGGALTAVGLGGPITGRGANVLLIDDYIKEIKEALSPTYRDYIWNWFTTTAMTRLEPNASVIIVATRWHEDDLIGRIIRTFGDEWEFIKLHAIARENDPLGRQPGEALFPERYPVEALIERKNLLGSHYYDAIYDQEPHKEGGNLTNRDWIKLVDALPTTKKYKFVRVWDLAGTEGGGDPTTGVLLAANMESQEVYICNVIRKQLGPSKVEKLVQDTAEADGQDVDIVIEREPGSSGKAVSNHYITQVVPDFNASDSYSNDHKEVKAQPFLAACEAGKVFILKDYWNEDYLREFDGFPGGKHDDQVDCCSIGYNKIFGKRKNRATFGRRTRQRHATKEEQDRILASQPRQDKESRHMRKRLSLGAIRRATFGRGY